MFLSGRVPKHAPALDPVVDFCAYPQYTGACADQYEAGGLRSVGYKLSPPALRQLPSVISLLL